MTAPEPTAKTTLTQGEAGALAGAVHSELGYYEIKAAVERILAARHEAAEAALAEERERAEGWADAADRAAKYAQRWKAERDALSAEVEAGRRLRAGVEALADALSARADHLVRALLPDTDGGES